MLVVIDTNVLISYFIRYRSTVGQAVDVILERHTPLYSAETLHEFVAKISSPKFAPYVSPTTIRTFVERYAALGRVVVEVEPLMASRDPKDDKFLSLAVAGNAECIVSGDKDLLILNPFRGIAILPPATFLGNAARP